MNPNFQAPIYNPTQNTFTNNPNPSSYMLNLNAKAFMASKQNKKNINLSTSPTNYHNTSTTRIKEVYEDNFIQEIKSIANYLTQYPYVGMDTEFPGIVYPCPCCSDDFYYKFTKANVDNLKLIQLGITLTNEKGEFPANTCSWQFNLKYDCDNDEHSNESITMLYNSGIDFNLMKNKGIPHDLFAEYLITSGLVLNENVTWICFNGISDFAYLLKLIINDVLPDEENQFNDLLQLYFPNIYDIKYLVNDNEAYKGGLNKLAKELNVERSGEIHQAGSDSQVTSDVFFRLIKNNVITNNDLSTGKNIIYGIGNGADDAETLTYTQFAPGVDISYLVQKINFGANFKNNNMVADYNH